MKVNTIYNELKALKETHDTNHKIDALIEKIRLSIIDDKVKESTPAAKWTAIKKLLKVNKDRRHVLSFIDTSNSDQRFTDSYRAFILKNEDMIKDLSSDFIHDEKNMNPYPDLGHLYPKKHEAITVIEATCKELKALCKVDDIITLEDEKMKVLMSSSYVDDMLKIMQFKNEDVISFYIKNALGPVLVEKESTGSRALILPIRHNY